MCVWWPEVANLRVCVGEASRDVDQHRPDIRREVCEEARGMRLWDGKRPRERPG